MTTPLISDDWQDRGLGSVVLADLLAATEARGIRRFRAYVLADNTPCSCASRTSSSTRSSRA